MHMMYTCIVFRPNPQVDRSSVFTAYTCIVFRPNPQVDRSSVFTAVQCPERHQLPHSCEIQNHSPSEEKDNNSLT